MSSGQPQSATSREADGIKSLCESVISSLQSEKTRIYEEIRNYPRPVPACDQHFNYLLEERERIARELARVNDLVNESLARGDSIEAIKEFIRLSGFTADPTERKILSTLKEEPS